MCNRNQKRFYSPQFFAMAAVSVRRLAWALGVSMPTAVDPSKVCLSCKDSTKYQDCSFCSQVITDSDFPFFVPVLYCFLYWNSLHQQSDHHVTLSWFITWPYRNPIIFIMSYLTIASTTLSQFIPLPLPSLFHMLINPPVKHFPLKHHPVPVPVREQKSPPEGNRTSLKRCLQPRRQVQAKPIPIRASRSPS